MYIVKVTIKPSTPSRPNVKFNKAIYGGLYIPRGNEKKVRHEKIKEKFENEVITILKNKKPSLDFDFTLKIEHNAMDFVLKSEEQ